MLAVELIGAALLIAGVVHMAWTTMKRGRMSDPAPNPDDPETSTLEPRHRGVGFLGLKANWPGVVMVIVGALMLLLPALLQSPGTPPAD